ncbi:hypothetical protein RIF25_03750 [Thermosynechococcaceae cyanobacterium BACA0444]|uniref:Uncharacterized protein n=1 Tax=Pseudocalidococcus azoricus BACA0444 TaxID=2918990 RepID=A0AAE4JVE9_9CYAN|nr:hypothetical protein [Pseudocalidococcus azoricus]MDS3859916.1 hypothetical protein [Pseudocalidococcus azoricus BACA0444]
MIQTLARQNHPQSEPALYLVESCRTDIHANQMMDELFRDIEAYLQAPNQQLKRLAPASTLARPSISLTQSSAATSLGLQTWDKIKNLSSERYFIGLGIASFLMAGGLLIGGILRDQGTPTSNVSPHPGDVEFARYASQALGSIRSTSRPTPNSGNQGLAHPPSPGLEPTTIISQDAQGNRVERVYIPVNSNTPTTTNTPANLSPTAVATSPSTPQPLTPVPPPPNNLAKVNQPMVAAKASVPTMATSLPAPVKPQNNLVGVIELGDRSMALIAHNGLVQRVSPGDVIDNSNWRLTGVQKQSVVLQRGSEVRTIQVGETF